jgi:hypothetical protein
MKRVTRATSSFVADETPIRPNKKLKQESPERVVVENASEDSKDVQGVESLVKEEEQEEEVEGVLLHPELTFSYQDAVDHLTKHDDRWSPLMASYKCRIFEGQQDGKFESLQRA